MTNLCKSGFLRPVTSNCRSVLIAIDGSEHSRTAFHYYLKYLCRSDDALTIYHAFESASPPSISLSNPVTIPSDEWSRIMFNNVQRIAELEKEYISECQAKSLNYQFLYEAVDQIGMSIVDKADKLSVNLVIVGSRGLGAVKRTILGSVSDYVLHHSNSAVCVVPHGLRL